MASVKDAEKLVTHVESALSDLKDALHKGDGNLDFERIAGLADEIGERADAVAETFSSLNEVLMGRIEDLSSNRQNRSARRSQGGSKKRAKAAS